MRKLNIGYYLDEESIAGHDEMVFHIDGTFNQHYLITRTAKGEGKLNRWCVLNYNINTHCADWDNPLIDFWILSDEPIIAISYIVKSYFQCIEDSKPVILCTSID